MLSILRVIGFAIQDMFRNISLSFMTVLILVLMLLSVNTFVFIQVLTDEATASIKEKIDVTVYFNHEATDEDITEIKEYIDSFPEVVDMTYHTKEEVLEQFREEHKDNADIVSSLNELGENPLGSTLIVKTREPSDYQHIIDALAVPEYESKIEAKTFRDTEKAIERINTITNQVEQMSLALTALFTLIAFLIIFNTIRVAIYTQRTEISIKKLVGATNWFIRGPYIIEAVCFSILSTAVTMVCVLGAVHVLDPFMSVVFEKPAILTNYFFSHILMLVSIECGVVLFLTIFSSLLAMRRYLRV